MALPIIGELARATSLCVCLLRYFPALRIALGSVGRARLHDEAFRSTKGGTHFRRVIENVGASQLK